METAGSSKMFIHTYKFTRRQIPEDHNFSTPPLFLHLHAAFIQNLSYSTKPIWPVSNIHIKNQTTQIWMSYFLLQLNFDMLLVNNNTSYIIHQHTSNKVGNCMEKWSWHICSILFTYFKTIWLTEKVRFILLCHFYLKHFIPWQILAEDAHKLTLIFK
jgi:hypothetical protein